MRPDEDTDETWTRADLWHDLRVADCPCADPAKGECGCEEDGAGAEERRDAVRKEQRPLAGPRIPPSKRREGSGLDIRGQYAACAARGQA